MAKGGFSWKRAAGISNIKSKIARATGIPTTKSGRKRKLGDLARKGFVIPSSSGKRKAKSGHGIFWWIFVSWWIWIFTLPIYIIKKCIGGKKKRAARNTANDPLIMSIDGKIKIVADCERLIATTKTPSVFFERYDLLLEYLFYLVNDESAGVVDFKKPTPSERHHDAEARREERTNDFIQRYGDDVLRSTSNLKTADAKLKRAGAFRDIFKKQSGKMTPANQALVDEYADKIEALATVVE